VAEFIENKISEKIAIDNSFMAASYKKLKSLRKCTNQACKIKDTLSKGHSRYQIKISTGSFLFL
jgi:hypothetical protein